MSARIYLIYLFIGAGLTACSFDIYQRGTPSYVDIRERTSTGNRIDTLVAPYQGELAEEMSRVIGKAEVDFVKQRPWGNLGNLVADAMLEHGRTLVSNNSIPVVCVLNHGGLRASLTKGEITVGDVFKLLPFDNELVLVQLPEEATKELFEWLKAGGGHPISGLKISGKEMKLSSGESLEQGVWVVTSDYLMNGGDHADFFQKGTNRISSNKMMRDVFLEYVEHVKVLKDNQDQRIVW
ncbi:MAG: hypothetical protein EP338_08155 [Bacteroidetes bacterium]|nr:MAG: hypothetical protein EP338_08155 [Bacteroidota bacterium]